MDLINTINNQYWKMKRIKRIYKKKKKYQRMEVSKAVLKSKKWVKIAGKW
jgi:hypothetical protein